MEQELASMPPEQLAKRQKSSGWDPLLFEVPQPGLLYPNLLGFKPRADIRGHTGFLTFARKPVPLEEAMPPPPGQVEEEEGEGANPEGEVDFEPSSP